MSVSKPLADALLHTFRFETSFWCCVVKKNIPFLIWSDIHELYVTGNRLTEAFHSFCRNTFVLQTLVQTLFCLLFYNVCQLFAILYSGLNKMWRKNYSSFVILRLERYISALIIISFFFVFPTLLENGLRPHNGCALNTLTCQHQSVTTHNQSQPLFQSLIGTFD